MCVCARWRSDPTIDSRHPVRTTPSKYVAGIPNRTCNGMVAKLAARYSTLIDAPLSPASMASISRTDKDMAEVAMRSVGRSEEGSTTGDILEGQ